MSSTLSDSIPLCRLPAVLRDLVGATAPSYRALYSAVLDGRVRTHQHNGRHHLSRADVAAVAREFGLRLPDDDEPQPQQGENPR